MVKRIFQISVLMLFAITTNAQTSSTKPKPNSLEKSEATNAKHNRDVENARQRQAASEAQVAKDKQASEEALRRREAELERRRANIKPGTVGQAK